MGLSTVGTPKDQATETVISVAGSNLAVGKVCCDLDVSRRSAVDLSEITACRACFRAPFDDSMSELVYEKWRWEEMAADKAVSSIAEDDDDASKGGGCMVSGRSRAIVHDSMRSACSRRSVASAEWKA